MSFPKRMAHPFLAGIALTVNSERQESLAVARGWVVGEPAEVSYATRSRFVTIGELTDQLADIAVGDVDLSGYVTTDQLATALSSQSDAGAAPYDDSAVVGRLEALEAAAAPTGVVLVEDPENPGALKFEVVSA